MNGPQNSGFPPSDPMNEETFLELVLKYQDDDLSSEETEALERLLLNNEEIRQRFIDIQMQSFAINGVFRRDAFGTNESETSTLSRSRSENSWLVPGIAALAALSLGLAAIGWLRPPRVKVIPAAPIAERDTSPANDGIAIVSPSEVPELNVRVTGLSGAQFFGEYNPPLNSLLKEKRDYILTEGLVELAFPAGATAILEAPAVFRILNDECLAMDTGRCSVHAPEGAEGFRVETPVTQVVDRGTRFLVTASEGMETEVHVVEGAADVYWKSDGGDSDAVNERPDVVARSSEASPQVDENKADSPSSPPLIPHPVRLERADAKRFSGTESVLTAPVRFTPHSYRGQLPDRIMSYEATRDANGRAQDLTSVTVKRDGVDRTYSAEELILTDLIWFKSYENIDKSGHLSGASLLPDVRGSWLGDLSLTSGVINPGGHRNPLNSDPVINEVEDPSNPNTPGFAVRFREPVVNGPGPDIVFFELQTLNNPPEGDPFHVSPMRFRPGLHSKTVETYDLTLFSAETLPLSTFYLYQFNGPIRSLKELEELSCTRTHMRIGFRALAVGIDLSKMGYAENEVVEELFFQDANDDPKNIVDPVFIAGLPSIPPVDGEDVLGNRRK